MINKKISNLDLRNKNLTEIPSDVFQLRNLRKLDLRNNKIKSIPKEIHNLKRLEILDISYNNIQNIYASLFKLEKLKILILSNNKIKFLPKQIEQLINLKILILSGNKLTALPAEIGNLSKLQELNISKNRFANFPRIILNLKQLKTLWINENYFDNLPIEDLISNFPNLIRLYCYGFLNLDIPNQNHNYIKLSRIKGNSIRFLKKIESIKQGEGGRNKSIDKPNLKVMEKAKIFICYSHEDIEYLRRLNVHLKVLNYENETFEVWDDTRIKPGKKWQNEIEKALNKCKIAILIISTDFLASDFIRTNELPPLLKNAEENGTIIIPLIARPSRFVKNKNISCFQAANPNLKPLSKLSQDEQDEILVQLTYDIETHFQ